MKKNVKFAGIAAVAAMALAGPAAANAAPSPETASPNIVGGNEVSINAAPFAAQVLSNGNFTCSASQISSQWVLTAQHCVGGNMSVNLGSGRLGSGTNVQVSTYYTYNGGDLALLKLRSPYYGSYASLEADTLQYTTGGSIFGWGRTTPNGPASSQLKTANVYIDGLAKDAYNGPAYRHYGVNGQAWKGDSGGPLVVNGKVIGVASTSASGGNDTSAYSWYASVPHGINWIYSVSGVSGS